MREVVAVTTKYAEHAVTGPDGAFVYSGINFVILILFLYFVLKKPVKEFFGNRSVKTKMRLDEVAKVHEEARRWFDAIKLKLKNVDVEKQELIKNFKNEAEQEKVRMMALARQSAQKIEEDAKRIAGHETQKARQMIKEETVRVCEDIVRQKIRQEVTDEDLKKLGSRSVVAVQKA